MTGYILIAAVLILGGVIATVGDRIGTRVGKKRLSLFNLRPKNTAVLVTIITGFGISASTLGILFLADEGLRKGVLQMDEIRRELRRKRRDLETQSQQLEAVRNEKQQVEAQLDKARSEKQKAQEELQKIDKSLQAANIRQKETQAQLNRTLDIQARTQKEFERTREQLGEVGTQYQRAISELQKVYEERKRLQTEIATERAESLKLYNEARAAINEAKTMIARRDRDISERDRRIANLDQLIQARNREISEREQIIAKREARLKELEREQGTLESEVARLEKYYQSFRDLRLGKLAIVRGQILASGVITVQRPEGATLAVKKLLEEANRNANLQLSEPGASPSQNNILEIAPGQIQQLSQKIKDGREYVVRIFSAGNYVRGEKQISFFADASVNQLLFKTGETLATTTADPQTMTSYQLRQRLDLLISASQFRARSAGILENIEVEGTFLRFLSELRQSRQPLEIKAIAATDTYTAGPLRLRLVAIHNGEIVFST
ncbi:DUF3084 domain-containing protein [Calothrix sp. NIES-3974]|uniref:DUF3084 domain-containing protein n=1 Tax=Calothrix sp. NIES-3974 TaxID=2005462 RepID=UPI000B5F6B37|nr:DUF3084 domain-containing protein [Calothrix sp. NIES-3974]BAZ04132.1 hypothetical protein NIES3974_07640 [Calothrix sp. NIES-3974]